MAGVTPAAGYITHGAALTLGLILGAISCVSAYAIRARFNIDDALDVSSVHGLTGVIGSLFTGFCFSNGSFCSRCHVILRLSQSDSNRSF